MALTDFKIVESDYTGRDISGLPNRPALPAPTLKARFDALVKNVVKVKFNGFIDAVVTAVSGLVSKVSGGTAGNFASLTADGSIADSGKKAADFEAAGAVAAHNTAASPHTGKFEAAGAASSAVSAHNGLSSAHSGHFTNRSNPHRVTAAQAGALPTTGGSMSGPIYSSGSFNQGAWNSPTQGALTVYTDNSGAQHSAVVGLDPSGERRYGMDFKDSTDPEMRLYSGTAWLELSHLSGVELSAPLAVASGGTGARTAANARANLGITRANLGIRTYAGTITLPSGYNYVTVYMSGVTSSYRAVAMRTGSTGTFDPAVPVSTVCGSGTVTVYFSASGGSGGTSVPIYIIATL